MIFCGDTVFPFKFNKNFYKELDKEFLQKEKIVNLESLIIDNKQVKKTTKGIALNSSKDIIHFFKFLNVKACSLANNHITDFEVSIEDQKDFLHENNISGFGAGDNLEKAINYFEFEKDYKKYKVFAFGWDIIGCKYATETSKGVNPMEYENIKGLIKNQKNIILIFHNNYEFELYPQPAHRKMFFDLVDEFDIKAIFCHHPHIVGGCEIYKNVPIFYSLGNFYLPETNYNGYNLKYNEEAKEGLCVEFNEKIEEIRLFWTYKDEKNNLIVTQKEKLLESKKIKDLTPFDNMIHDKYIKWFEKNRKKKRLLPIYKNYNSKFKKVINKLIVINRQKIIDLLVRLKVK